MSWRTVTENDLTAALSEAELNAFRNSAAEDPVDAVIRSTVAYVRGVIRSAPSRVRMSPGERDLPESLIVPAMDLARWNVLTRMNLVVNESRTKAYERANQLLDDVRAGKFIPESAADEPETAAPAGSPASAPARPARMLD